MTAEKLPITPSESEVSCIVAEYLNCEAQSVRRFSMGLFHYVFDVQTKGGKRIIVRISTPVNRDYLRGGLYWNEKLRPLGVPLPKVLAHDLRGERPFVILERLAGVDLNDCYTKLSAEQKQSLACQIVEIQRHVSTLPEAKGYGFAFSYEDKTLSQTSNWLQVLIKHLDRSRGWINQTKLCDENHVDRVQAALEGHHNYFDNVPPSPFLGDITTKNVIMEEGRLSGIVDVDDLAFGDSLLTLGLTEMSLLSSGWSTDYIGYWKESLAIGSDQEEALRLYTAMFCVCFMGELGMTFNRDESPSVSPDKVGDLEGILESLLEVGS